MLTVAVSPAGGNVADYVDFLLVQLSFVQIPVDPMEMLGRIRKIQQDPEVEIVANISVQ